MESPLILIPCIIWVFFMARFGYHMSIADSIISTVIVLIIFGIISGGFMLASGT